MGKRRKYNYNYAFVLYDINEKRVNKVFKVCKKYLRHHQKSIFRGNITPSNLMKLKNELLSIINKDEDFITILKFFNENYFEEETLGINLSDSETMFI